jgi:DNA-binding MarR family transcriptional regulator
MACGHDIAMALRTAYWAMHRQTGAAVARHGVTADQFVLLSLLAGSKGVTQQELVRRAASDANTVRAMLVLLERQGLVQRRPHPTDGRARSVSLTRKGYLTFDRAWADTETLRQCLASAVEGDGGDAFLEELKRAAEAVAAGGSTLPAAVGR